MHRTSDTIQCLTQCARSRMFQGGCVRGLQAYGQYRLVGVRSTHQPLRIQFLPSLPDGCSHAARLPQTSAGSACREAAGNAVGWTWCLPQDGVPECDRKRISARGQSAGGRGVFLTQAFALADAEEQNRGYFDRNSEIQISRRLSLCSTSASPNKQRARGSVGSSTIQIETVLFIRTEVKVVRLWMSGVASGTAHDACRSRRVPEVCSSLTRV